MYKIIIFDYICFLMLLDDNLGNNKSYRIFESCDPDAGGGAWSCQSYEVTGPNVAGKKRRAHLRDNSYLFYLYEQ